MPSVYFTFGLCEPHGPQNAVGWSAKAQGIACAAAGNRRHRRSPDFWHIHE